MKLTPDFASFAQCHDAGQAQVVSLRLVADLETPVSALLKLARGSAYHFLLESVEGGSVRGRYSMIGAKPDMIWRVRGASAEINRNALADEQGPFEAESCDPLTSLRRLLARSRIELPPELPPMSAGLFGYMGYDLARLMERLPPPNPDVLGLDDALFIRPTIMAIFDSVCDEIILVAPVFAKSGLTAADAYARASARIQEALDALERPHDGPRDGERSGHDRAAADIAEVTSNTPEAAFRRAVRQAKGYITAGDIFQVVLSQRFEVEFPLPPFALYRALRRINPSPFLYFLAFGSFAIVGSSPEILVRVRDGEVTIRPIAGTRRRGATAGEDRELARELLADPKERAEHLMLLDLGRNDLGRVARTGSVRVTDQFIIEYYSQVMHIVSNVVGELADDRDIIDALCAAFPAGTVSGAPKIRAMEIIDELEREKRGIYAGCVGYFSAGGDMDTCIVLRTAIVKDGRMFVQAGAGVVADSDPGREHAECTHKARALFRAAQEAVRFANRGGRV